MNDSESRSQWKTLGTLVTYLWPPDRRDLRMRVVAAMGFLLLGKAVNVCVPYLFKLGVDALAPQPSVLTLPLFLIVAYGLARVLAQLFGELRDLVFIEVSQNAQRVIGLKTFQHLHALPLSFHLERQTGGLSRVIDRGTKGIQFVLTFMLFNILPTLVEIFLVTAILFQRFNAGFAAVVLLTIVLYVGYSFGITNWRLRYRREMNQTDTEANTKAVDSLLNFETVKYFGNETHEHRRFDRSLAAYETASVKSQLGLSLLNIGQGTIIGTGLIFLMVMAGRGVVEGKMSVGDFVMVNTYLIQLYLPLNFLGFVYREIKQGLIDMEKMFGLLAVYPTIQDAPNASKLVVNGGEIEFDKVGFYYASDRTILKDVSFRVQPGKSVAIVGPSGAGKSTISRLLFRFYDVTSGAIRIDGQDIRQVTQESLRSAIGIVPQDTVLFNDTIGYNIRYGRVGATEEEVLEAARLAHIDDFVQNLSAKYETVVGERGLKLSGGEKQRVSIARTILKSPQILLFDEATSSLDSHTEKDIQASLYDVSKNRTSLMIAHRLSTVVDADEILVLKEGRIVERGTHGRLLVKGGEYASMWARQQEAERYEEEFGEEIRKRAAG
ncbi:MAG TPA: ABC transporter ATP-binding protein/permease [Bdellovibrionota bacterium]|nr:ABC transporter ATP-binding protein/permease [Bdellovibrionota bacterium]